jgi:hypothetical protein
VRLVLRVVLPAREREFYLGDLEEGGRRPWLREVAGAVALRLGRRVVPARLRDASGRRGSGAAASHGTIEYWGPISGSVCDVCSARPVRR